MNEEVGGGLLYWYFIDILCNSRKYPYRPPKERGGGGQSSYLSYMHPEIKLRVLLTGYTVAMVTCYIQSLTATCLPMIGHL